MDQVITRPWFQFWPKDVPKNFDFPEIPLSNLLVNTAAKYPDKVGYVNPDGKTITFSQLDKNTTGLATYLTDYGLKKGETVMVILPNGIDFVTAYYGILKAGGIVVPSNPMYREEEIRYQINDCSAAAIVTDNEHYMMIKNIKQNKKLRFIILVDGNDPDTVSLKNILAEHPGRTPSVFIQPKIDSAAIEYTGGTTGFPKGAVLTHYNLVSNAIQNALWFQWGPEDVIIGVLPFYHSWGASSCVNSAIYTGARVLAFNHFNDEALLKAIEREKATVMYGATSMFIMLTNSPLISKYNISSLRYVKAGAMPIPPEIRTRWEQVTGVKMVSGYGLSEASPETHNSPLGRLKEGNIGIPITGTDARIVDEATGTVDLPAGEVGELIIKGPQVMKGYLNRPEDNKEALRDGWLYTGDLASMDGEGYFRIVDRKKETIKFKGYTIAPAEIEATIYQHPAVKECAVVGKPDTLSGEIPKAFIVLKDGHTVTKEELIKFCEGRVAGYKRIREVEFTDALPKTPVGKLLRRVLRDRER